MFSRKRPQLLSASVLVLALGALAYGGGYWLEFADPSASKDPAAKDAIALVRALGCGEPTKSTVTAKAEGLIAGERKSVELQVVPLSKPGMYALKGNLPDEGKWVISVAGAYLGARTGTVAALTSKGFDRKSAKSMPHEPARTDIDAVLIAAR
jgi:hypothetical protein